MFMHPLFMHPLFMHPLFMHPLFMHTVYPFFHECLTLSELIVVFLRSPGAMVYSDTRHSSKRVPDDKVVQGLCMGL
jgi:hypothetical protein